jgi:hypothetical protein
MASGNFSSSSINGLSLYVEWSSTENISANTSSVTATLYVKSYGFRATALSGSYLTINGNTRNWVKTFSISDTSILTTTHVSTHTVTVPHNADGTKSITIKANMKLNGTYGGTYISDLTASKSVTLTTIPRASSFSVPSSVNTGSSLKIAISPSSSSFRHKFQFEVDGSIKYTSNYVEAGITSYSYAIPHSWIPKTPSKDITVYCYTYPASGNDYIARTIKTCTANVPSNIKPSITGLTATVVNGLNGKYIQGKSKIKLTATAKTSDGSTISSYIFKGDNIAGTSSLYTTTSTSTSCIQTSGIIQSSNSVTYQVAVSDARGRTSDYQSVSINVYPYAAPQVTSISAQRCLADGTLHTDGTYAKVTVKTSYASIDGANTRTVKLYNSKDDFATGTTVLAVTNTAGTYTGVYGSGFEPNQSYTIKATIDDEYGKNSKTTTLQVSERTINIAKHGNGVAIGGLSSVTNASDVGKFECSWDAYFNDSLYVTNKITGQNPYNARNFNINCYWKDGQAHDILVRSTDGLTVGLGWVGSDTYPTVLDMRPTKVRVRGNTDFESSINCYMDDELVLKTDKDETSAYVRSLPTYNRTYDASPNVYITSLGTFGRGTSSSQRYKTDIEDVKDSSLDPYKILDIPVRQYKYNQYNIPVNKSADDLYIGCVAEEVAKIYPAAAEYNEDGQVEMWNIKVIVPAMLKILQDQQKEIEVLKEEIQQLKINSQGG